MIPIDRTREPFLPLHAAPKFKPLLPAELGREPRNAATMAGERDLLPLHETPKFQPLDSLHSAPLTPDQQHQQLTQQAELLVSQTFFGTLLKQSRESPFRSELFDGGRGGQAFGAMYDQQLAEHMARGVGQKLVKSIVRQLEARKAYERAHPAERRQDRPVAGESSKDVRNHVTPGLRA